VLTSETTKRKSCHINGFALFCCYLIRAAREGGSFTLYLAVSFGYDNRNRATDQRPDRQAVLTENDCFRKGNEEDLLVIRTGDWYLNCYENGPHTTNGNPDIYGIGIFGWKLDGSEKGFIRDEEIGSTRSLSGGECSECISAVKIKTVLLKSNIFFPIFVRRCDGAAFPQMFGALSPY
jgi:hypothetical protein